MALGTGGGAVAMPHWSVTQRSSLRPIVHPSRPRWWGALMTFDHIDRRTAAPQLLAVLVVVAAIVLPVVAALAQPLVGLLLGAAAATSGAIAGLRAWPHVVVGPGWRFEGVPITREGLRWLEDIDGRFAYAEGLIRTIPTGIDLDDHESDIRAVLWDAAGLAARLSTVEAELHELRYAAAGTPQAALRQSLVERRDEVVAGLERAQWEAEQLARAAGNAAAAARVALARTGSVSALDVVAPTGRTLLARENLAAARARLDLLASAWSELDPTAAVLAEQLDAERRAGEEPGAGPRP